MADNSHLCSAERTRLSCQPGKRAVRDNSWKQAGLESCSREVLPQFCIYARSSAVLFPLIARVTTRKHQQLHLTIVVKECGQLRGATESWSAEETSPRRRGNLLYRVVSERWNCIRGVPRGQLKCFTASAWQQHKAGVTMHVVCLIAFTGLDTHADGSSWLFLSHCASHDYVSN